MKLNLKTLVAAAALAVVAGQASAAFVPLETAATGSGLVFYAYNESGPTSFVQDLGKLFNDFLPATNNTTASNFSLSLSGTAWTNYLASVGGDLTTTYWGVVSTKNNAGYGLLTTIRDGEDLNFNNTSTSALTKGAVGTVRNALIAINGATPAAGVSSYYSASASADNFFNATGHDLAGKVGFDTDNLVGTTSSFLYMNPNVTSNLVTTTYANTEGTASTFAFNGATVSFTVAPVAAVPEASELAMLLSGFAMVGGIVARRRKSAK